MKDKKKLTINCAICDTRKIEKENYSHYEQIIINATTIIMNANSKRILSQLPVIMNNEDNIELSQKCVILPSSFNIDKYFPIRAKDYGEYFVADEVLLQDETVDLQKLIQKNVIFRTKRVIFPESKLEECAALFDETCEFIMIPQSMAFLHGNIELNHELIEKNGTRIFVYGNVSFNENCKEICNSLEELIVKGKVILTENLLDEFNKLNVEYEQLEIVKGIQIKNQLRVKVDNELLKNQESGIEIRNVVKVEIDNAVKAKDIQKFLTFRNCVYVICNELQQGAVESVAINVACIGKANPDIEQRIFMSPDSNVINSEYHEM